MKDKWKEGRERVEVFLYPEEFKILKDVCKKANESYSEYIRMALMWDLVSDGNIEAMKLTAKRGVHKVLNRLRQKGVLSELESMEKAVKE